MKVALVFVFLGIGLAFAKTLEGAEREQELQILETPQEEPVVVSPNVKELLGRFVGLIDKTELTKFLFERLTLDPQAQAVYHYLRSEKAKAIVAHLNNEPEYTKFIRWLHDNGFTHIYECIKGLHKFFGWDSTSTRAAPEVVVDEAFAKSLQTLFEDLTEVLPMNSMAMLAMELYESGDPAAVLLIERLQEPGMGEAWRRLVALPEMQELSQALMAGALPLDIFLVILEAFFGWA